MYRSTRPTPVGPPQAYLTYAMTAPLRTHWRRATCAEFECASYLNGWLTVLPSDDARCDYIRQASGRRFTECAAEAGMTEFRFEPGQVCFGESDHRVPVGRPPLYVVRHGDWRAWKPLRRHGDADGWVNDLYEHEQQLAKARE